MKRLLQLVLLLSTACNTLCAYSSSTSISTCINYENNSSYKWCRYYTTTSSGYACDATDTSLACGGSSSSKCSSDSSTYLPQNSKKLLHYFA